MTPSLAVGMFLLALVLAVPHASAGATTFASPEEAIGAAVAGLGMGYAGDCAATRSPDDLGKVCSKLVAQQGNERAYLAGRTFSEFSEWVFVEEEGASWSLIGTLPLDGSASPLTVPWPSP